MCRSSNRNRTGKTKGTDAWVYTYDYDNRLTKLEENSATIGEYVYDGNGKRIRVTENTVTTTYVCSGLKVLYEENMTLFRELILSFFCCTVHDRIQPKTPAHGQGGTTLVMSKLTGTFVTYIKLVNTLKLMKLIIIGLGTAGYAAAMEAAKRGADITIIEKRDFETFSPCGLPYVIDGSIPRFEDLKHAVRLRNTEKLLSHEVESIDVHQKTVAVKDLESGDKKNIVYDKLIIATGASPLVPPITGVRELLGEGTFVISGIGDTSQMKEKAESSESCVVVGAGAVGSETACTLHNKGLDVTMVEMLPHMFPQALDADIASEVKTHIESVGIPVYVGSKVESVKEENGKIIVSAGKKYTCDFALITCGVRANYTLAEKAGIEIGKWGIKVTPGMETSAKDVYACGDCIETFSYLNGEPWMMQMATSALRMGPIAAANALGGDAAYEGCLNTFASELAGKDVASCGFTEKQAEGFGYETAVGKGTGTVTADYYPGKDTVRVKLIVNKKDHTLLGGQAFGAGAFWRVNVISLALKARMTVDEFSKMELAYTPPLAPSYDALQKACDFVLRRL